MAPKLSAERPGRFIVVRPEVLVDPAGGTSTVQTLRDRLEIFRARSSHEFLIFHDSYAQTDANWDLLLEAIEQ